MLAGRLAHCGKQHRRALCQRKTHARNDDNSAGPNTVEPDRASLKGLRSASRSAGPTLSPGAGPPCAPAAGQADQTKHKAVAAVAWRTQGTVISSPSRLVGGAKQWPGPVRPFLSSVD